MEAINWNTYQTTSLVQLLEQQWQEQKHASRQNYLNGFVKCSTDAGRIIAHITGADNAPIWQEAAYVTL